MSAATLALLALLSTTIFTPNASVGSMTVTRPPPIGVEDPCNVTTRHVAPRIRPTPTHRKHHHRHRAVAQVVHRPLSFRLVNHRFVRPAPPPGCVVGGGGTSVWRPEVGSEELPELALGTPDELTIPGVEDASFELGGYGPLPIDYGDVPGLVGGLGYDRPRPTRPSGEVSAAPEPGSWSLLLLGTGWVGWTLRRRTEERADMRRREGES